MRSDYRFLIAFSGLPVALGLIYFALNWRSPEFAAYRWLSGTLFIAITFLFLVGQSVAIRRSEGASPVVKRLVKSVIVLLLAALASFLSTEIHFQWMRYSVMHADRESASRLGRHFIVGFRSTGFAEDLITRNGTGGIFITAHNVRGQDAGSIRATIERFQSLQRANGTKPLWVAADQEGGIVSRMSPPLTAQPSLGELVTQHSSDGNLESAVRAYGKTQATALAALGINLNFAPVIDINNNIVNEDDRYTRIYQRAISTDPRVVERVAGWYCDALYENGVRCTLKHFPGLGRVQTDTHLDSAKLTLPVQSLVQSEWVPFKSLMKPGQRSLTMLSHVQLDAIDSVHPVSTSRLVVDILLRKEWHYDGLLITDDFSMGAITQREGGIGAATIDALNAGVDLILISYDPDQYYPAMYALLGAERAGKIDQGMLERSRERLDAITTP